MLCHVPFEASGIVPGARKVVSPVEIKVKEAS
jgi:hypothetical protein